MEPKNVRELQRSLVGSSIEFRFSKRDTGATPASANFAAEKSRIRKSIDMAFSADRDNCLVLLAEMFDYYRGVSYYMAVRSAIELRRMRPFVLDYVKELSIDDREERLKKLLVDKSDKQRDSAIEALRYFLSTYKSRLKNFRSLLTKEELLLVA